MDFFMQIRVLSLCVYFILNMFRRCPLFTECWYSFQFIWISVSISPAFLLRTQNLNLSSFGEVRKRIFGGSFLHLKEHLPDVMGRFCELWKRRLIIRISSISGNDALKHKIRKGGVRRSRLKDVVSTHCFEKENSSLSILKCMVLYNNR